LGGKAQLFADVDEQLLDAAHVGDNVDWLRQAHDRVADELARAVPGDFSAPVDVDDGCAVVGPFKRLGAPAGRVHAGVFE
jgi:hypothetical protein